MSSAPVARGIRRRHRLLPVHHQRPRQAAAPGTGRPRLDREPRETGGRRAADRLGADRGQVHAQVLARLDQLHQHAAGAVPPQPCATREQGIGALDRLDAEHEALLHHAALPDIHRTERPRHRDAAGDVGQRLRLGPDGAEQAGLDQQRAEHLLRAHRVEPLLAQQADHGGEQAVIAAEQGPLAQPGHEAQAVGVEAHHRKRRPRHAAGQHHVADAVRLQQRDHPPDLRQRHHLVRMAGEVGRVGMALDQDAEHAPPGLGRGIGDAQRHDAAARDKAEGSALPRGRHQLGSASSSRPWRPKGHSPCRPRSRTKSRISATCGLSG
jgi:hypothetical protein